MRIVVSQTLGELGSDEVAPVFFEWRWHHYAPGWSFWILIVLVLLGRKANRNWQAWLILIPLFVVTALWHISVRLVSIPSSTAELSGLVVSLWAMGWSVVWLLADRLGGRRRVAAFALALGVTLSIGAWWYAAHFGLGDTDEVLALLMTAGFGVLVLLVAMGLSSLCCRRWHRPGRFMGWLLLWTLVAFEVTALAVYGSVATAVGPDPEEMIGLLVMSLLLGGALYLANLPFMILAFRSPFYSARFQRLFDSREAFEPRAPAGGELR